MCELYDRCWCMLELAIRYLAERKVRAQGGRLTACGPVAIKERAVRMAETNFLGRPGCLHEACAQYDAREPAS